MVSVIKGVQIDHNALPRYNPICQTATDAIFACVSFESDDIIFLAVDRVHGTDAALCSSSIGCTNFWNYIQDVRRGL